MDDLEQYISPLCPQSEQNVQNVRDNPGEYLQVDMMRRHRVVDSFFIPAHLRAFTYNKKKFTIDDESVFLQPFRDRIMSVVVISEEHGKGEKFKKLNRGITGKAMALLYKDKLYQTLLTPSEEKYNLFVILLVIVQLVALCVVAYLLFAHGVPEPVAPLPPGGEYPYPPGFPSRPGDVVGLIRMWF